MARKKAKKQKAHKRLRPTCKICGKRHTKSDHSFHGVGAYGTSRSLENIIKAQAKAKRKSRRR